DSLLIPAVASLAVAAPFILFQWLVRRACYTALRPEVAAQAGAIYMLVMMTGLYGIYLTDHLGMVTALGVMAVASLVSGLWPVLRLDLSRFSVEYREIEKESLSDHWRYGRWAMVTGVMRWI